MTMKVRSLALVLTIVLVLGPAAVVLASSNPFSDVPADHWAYDAVTQLAAVGLVEGYPDGTYGGTRMMTRYEAALVFARTLARLEAMVEEEVYATNADLRAQVVAEVLADIEAAKAELAALIKEELANIEVPVVEHTIERVVVEQPIEKIVEVQPVERPFQLTPEAENVIAKLVGDLFKKELEAAELSAQQAVVETKIIERIVEAEDAVTEEDVYRIAEAILATELEKVYAAQDSAIADVEKWIGTVVRRVHALEAGQADLAEEVAGLAEENNRLAGLVDGLQADVNGLEAALVAEIARVTDSIYALNNELRTELALLGVRVDTLEKLFVTLEDRISGVEGRVAQVEKEQDALRKDLERVQLSGKLTFNASSSSHTSTEDAVHDYFETEYKHNALVLTQKGELKLTVKASDSTTISAFAAYDVNILGKEDTDYFTFKDYRVEVTSDTPITKFVAGNKIDDFKSSLINSYVLGKKLNQGAAAEFKFFEGFTGAAIVGGKADNLMGGAGLSYKFIPELGLKAAVSGSRNDSNDSKVNAASAGIFGELFGFTYEGNFAIDLTNEDNAEDNMLFGGKLTFKYDPVEVWGEYVFAGDKFGAEGSLSSRPFVDTTAAKSKFELGANAEFLGIDVSGNYYREMGEENAQLISAYKFGATAEFDLFVPLTLSGNYAWNLTGKDADPKDAVSASEVKVAVGPIDVAGTGLSVDGSFALVNGRLADGKYKVAKEYDDDKKAYVIGANLGYAATVGGAGLDLGYGVEFVMPRVEEGDTELPNELTHSITADYSFTDDLKLELGATIFHQLVKDGKSAQKYTAGLTFTF